MRRCSTRSAARGRPRPRAGTFGASRWRARWGPASTSIRHGRGGSSRSWRSRQSQSLRKTTARDSWRPRGRSPAEADRRGDRFLARARAGPTTIRGGDRVDRTDKERVVAELTERLKTTDTLIVADYRGLTMTQIDDLRSELLKHGARFAVVKNTLTRRAAEAAGADMLLGLLEGPTAIAFLEADGDPVAVAKAPADAARTTPRVPV